MYLYKWLGSEEEGVAIVQQYPAALQLKNEEASIVFFESAEQINIPQAEQYEVLDATGELAAKSFAVCNNIPVTDDGREQFEGRFQNRARLIEHEQGFVAIRVLRPLQSDTYVILTLWESEIDFINWQESQAYNKAHTKRGTQEGIDQRPNIFPRSSFVTTYA